MGKPNASVFPDPVSAAPTTSCYNNQQLLIYRQGTHCDNKSHSHHRYNLSLMSSRRNTSSLYWCGFLEIQSVYWFHKQGMKSHFIPCIKFSLVYWILFIIIFVVGNWNRHMSKTTMNYIRRQKGQDGKTYVNIKLYSIYSWSMNHKFRQLNWDLAQYSTTKKFST